MTSTCVSEVVHSIIPLIGNATVHDCKSYFCFTPDAHTTIFNETGVMTCIDQASLNDVGRALNNINVKEFEEAMENTELITNTNIQEILKLITTKNKSLGHTSKAAKDE